MRKASYERYANATALEFEDRIAPCFRGFTADQMEAVKQGYISNKLDNYTEWYAWHVRAFGELMPEYGPDYLLSIYNVCLADGDTAEEAYIYVTCCALERDF